MGAVELFNKYKSMAITGIPKDSVDLIPIFEQGMRFGWRARGIEDLLAVSGNERQAQAIEDVKNLHLPITEEAK